MTTPSARAVYLTMLEIAERDLSGDALEARRQEILDLACTGGWELPSDFEAVPEHVQRYDDWNRSGKLAASAGADAFPSAIPAAQFQFWQSVVAKDAPADPNVPGR